jgi:hypothetical protein
MRLCIGLTIMKYVKKNKFYDIRYYLLQLNILHYQESSKKIGIF